jgi:hypothetical protein
MFRDFARITGPLDTMADDAGATANYYTFIHMRCDSRLDRSSLNCEPAPKIYADAFCRTWTKQRQSANRKWTFEGAILLHANPVRLAQLQRILKPNEAVLEYFTSASSAYCLIISRRKATLARLPEDLSKLIQRHLTSIASNANIISPAETSIMHFCRRSHGHFQT